MPPPRVNIHSADAAVIEALASHVTKILAAFRQQGQVNPRWAVQGVSQLNIERELLGRQLGPQGSWDVTAAEYAGDAALLFLLVQAEHLAVLGQIYRSHTGLMFGLGPPARSLLELNGYVFWLLHPDVESIRTRASRVLLSKLNDATRERTAAKDLSASAHDLTRLGERVNKLKASVYDLFYASELARDKSGDWIIRGEKHPGPGEVLSHLSVSGSEHWNSRGAYSFLSNSAHPTLHVVTDTIQFDSGGVATHFGYPDTQYQYRLARMAMTGFLRTWQITSAYRGLDQTVAQQLATEIDTLPEPLG